MLVGLIRYIGGVALKVGKALKTCKSLCYGFSSRAENSGFMLYV